MNNYIREMTKIYPKIFRAYQIWNVSFNIQIKESERNSFIRSVLQLFNNKFLDGFFSFVIDYIINKTFKTNIFLPFTDYKYE